MLDWFSISNAQSAAMVIPGRRTDHQITNKVQFTRHFNLEEEWGDGGGGGGREGGGRWYWNEPRRQKLGRQNSWQTNNHAKLYSDLLKAYKREFLIVPDSQPMGFKFLLTPTTPPLPPPHGSPLPFRLRVPLKKERGDFGRSNKIYRRQKM